MSAKGCPLRLSKDVLAEIFCNVCGWWDFSGGYRLVWETSLIKFSGSPSQSYGKVDLSVFVL